MTAEPTDVPQDEQRLSAVLVACLEAIDEGRPVDRQGLLARHPEVEARVRDEIAAVTGGAPLAPEHVEALAYTRQTLQEPMRLYPPAFGFTRFAIASDEMGGYPVPATSVIFLSAYCTHRHTAFWEEPEVFDPQRFAPERAAGRPRFAYFPFGGGPRQCIGNTFAMMEAQLEIGRAHV